MRHSTSPWAAMSAAACSQEHLRTALHLALDEHERAREEMRMTLAELQGCAYVFGAEAATLAQAAEVEQALVDAAATAAPPNAEGFPPMLDAEGRKAHWQACCAAAAAASRAQRAKGSLAWLAREQETALALQAAAPSMHARWRATTLAALRFSTRSWTRSRPRRRGGG